MSVFLERVRKYGESYNLSKVSRLGWYLHYPLVKANWHAEYGKGLKKSLSKRIVPLFKNYTFWNTVRGPSQSEIKVPVGFHPEDLSSFSEIFFGGEYVFPWSLEDIDTYVDLGANTGMAALYFSSQFSLKRSVLVEANPSLLPVLRKNISSLKNCIVENICISGHANEELVFYLAEGHRHSSLEPIHGAKEIRVMGKSLSQLVGELKMESIDLLKFDIEGAEYDLIDLDPEAFGVCRYIVAEVHGEKEKRDSFAKIIRSLGFEIKRVEKGHFPCENLFARKI